MSRSHQGVGGGCSRTIDTLSQAQAVDIMGNHTACASYCSTTLLSPNGSMIWSVCWPSWLFPVAVCRGNRTDIFQVPLSGSRAGQAILGIVAVGCAAGTVGLGNEVAVGVVPQSAGPDRSILVQVVADVVGRHTVDDRSSAVAPAGSVRVLEILVGDRRGFSTRTPRASGR